MLGGKYVRKHLQSTISVVITYEITYEMMSEMALPDFHNREYLSQLRIMTICLYATNKVFLGKSTRHFHFVFLCNICNVTPAPLHFALF